MSRLTDLYKKIMYGQAGMDIPGQGMSGGTQGLFGQGGQQSGGLIDFNKMNNQQGGLLQNIPQTALLGSAIFGQGVQGKDPFSALLPAVAQTAQLQKYMTPKDTRVPLQKLAESMGLKVGSPEYNQFIRASSAKTGEGFTALNAKNIDTGNKLKGSFGVLAKQIPDLIKRVNESQTGFAGNVVSGLNILGDQAEQFKDIVSVDSNFSKKAGKEIDDYLKTQGITKKAQNYASVRSSIMNVAYTLASIAEPGNPKYSEGDIKRQLDRIGWGGSRDQITAGLTQILKDEFMNAQSKFNVLSPNQEFGYNINDILGGGTAITDRANVGTDPQLIKKDPFGIR